MVDFFDSKFMKDLENGILPPVEIEVPASVYIFSGLTICISALIIIIAFNYLKK